MKDTLLSILIINLDVIRVATVRAKLDIFAKMSLIFYYRKAKMSQAENSKNLSCWKGFKLRTAMVSSEQKHIVRG